MKPTPENGSGRLGLKPDRRRVKKTNDQMLPDWSAVVNADRELLEAARVKGLSFKARLRAKFNLALKPKKEGERL
jgi:hypothetical protein